jgi:hypothetical protein
MSYQRFRPNRIVTARLRRLLAFLDANRDRFHVQSFGRLAATRSIQGPTTATIADLGLWRPAVRKVVQVVNSLYWV